MHPSRLLASLLLAVGTAASAMAFPVVSQAASFRALPLPPGGTDSTASDVSDDGSVVVGGFYLTGHGGRAFRWTSNGGMVDLGVLPGEEQSGATGVSADGSVVVGYSCHRAASGASCLDQNSEAFRWTASSGMIGLGSTSLALGVSGDGSVIVGRMPSSQDIYNSEAFRWTASGGIVRLGFLPGDNISGASGASADGSLVVGNSALSGGEGGGAFRWTASGGMAALGVPMGAAAVSADGAVVVGGAFGQAARWTASSGLLPLGVLPGGDTSSAWGVSADGSVVVGNSDTSTGRSGAFVWDSAHGMRGIQQLLTAEGLNLAGWTLATARAVSADGNTIVGFGSDPNDHQRAWIANVGHTDDIDRIEWVPVGSPGNAPDTASNCFGAPCGQVDYNYYISKYDVTNAQYAEFLNAVAASDPYSLYNPAMGSDASNGGITRSGSSGIYTYAVKAGFAHVPVTYVSFYDAARFANWLSTGTTETGAYTLIGGTPSPSNGLTVTRNPGAVTFLPSENEWYKAAYYDAATASYFAFPAGSSAPTECTAPGATPNTANCGGVVGHVTHVGAYAGSASPNGTFDQGGNVYQWNEQIVAGSARGLRGGGWDDDTNESLAAASPNLGVDPADDSFPDIGFRVASVAPLVPVRVEAPWIVAGSPDPLPVTILGSDTVDVTEIDVTTLRFGPRFATPLQLSLMDANQDGDLDLVAAFGVQDAGLALGYNQPCLQGQIEDQLFRSCPSVVIGNLACGLGVEFAPILPPLLWLLDRRRRKAAEAHC